MSDATLRMQMDAARHDLVLCFALSFDDVVFHCTDSLHMSVTLEESRKL